MRSALIGFITLAALSCEPPAYAQGSAGLPGPFAEFLAEGQTQAQLTSGTIDAQPVIAAMVLAQGVAVLPCGTYSLAKPLILATNGSGVQGASVGCVTLNVTFPAGDIITITGQRVRLQDLTINAAVQRTAGAVIHMAASYETEVGRIAVTGPHGGDAILGDGSVESHVHDIDCRPAVQPKAGSYVSVSGPGACIHAVNTALDLLADHVSSYAWAYGLQLTSASGVVVSTADFMGGKNGVLFDPPTGTKLWAVHLTDVQADTSSLDGLLLGGAGFITDVQIDNLWSSNSQLAAGIDFNNPNINGVQIVSPNILYNHTHGILINQGKNIQISSATVQGNSKQGSALYHGLTVSGQATADQITILGGHFGPGGIDVANGNPPLQGYGIAVVALGGTETRHITIMGAQAVGNVTGGFNVPAGANVVMLGNSQ